jgi:hypothetical protein
MIKYLNYLILLCLSLLPLVSSAVDWTHRLGGGVEDIVIKNMVSEASVIRSQNSFKKGKKEKTLRTYSVDSDGETVIVLEVEENAEILITNPSGTDVLVDELLIAEESTKNVLRVLLNTEGVWQIGVSQKELLSKYLSIEQSSGPTLVAKIPTFTVLKGSSLELDVTVQNKNNHIKKFTNEKLIALISTPNGNTRRLVVRDNGLLGDKYKNDDEINVPMIVRKRGQYDVQIFWSGKPLGKNKTIRRTALLTYFVSENDIRIKTKEIIATRANVLGEVLEPNRFGLPVKIKSKSDLPDHVVTYAEVWGQKDGVLNPVGWIGGKLPIKDNIIPFSFHNGWINNNDYSPPYVLKNIKIFNDEDINLVRTNNEIKISRLTSETISPDRAKTTELPDEDLQTSLHISDEMLFGVDPLELKGRSKTVETSYKRQTRNAQVVGSRAWRQRNPVLFLHGYCESHRGTWTPKNSAALDSLWTPIFQSNEVLLYPNSNKGEDTITYMNELRRWLGNQNIDGIRGIVAYSHGGMVAASLLQYHGGWFVSNKAYSPRYKIISVATPYNGMSGLEGGSILRGKIAKEIRRISDKCWPTPIDFFPSHNWKKKISSSTKYRIHSIYTDHGSRDEWWHGPATCNSFSVLLRGRDDGLLRNTDTRRFASKDTYVKKRCHTRSGSWLEGMKFNPGFHAPQFVSAVDEQFNNFKPYCSSTRDPDGDGWGWENGKSCVIPTNSGTPFCQNPNSDPDGDGWGWENGRSCLVQ